MEVAANGLGALFAEKAKEYWIAGWISAHFQLGEAEFTAAVAAAVGGTGHCGFVLAANTTCPEASHSFGLC
jgi:hypothetical protein